MSFFFSSFFFLKWISFFFFFQVIWWARRQLEAARLERNKFEHRRNVFKSVSFGQFYSYLHTYLHASSPTHLVLDAYSAFQAQHWFCLQHGYDNLYLLAFHRRGINMNPTLHTLRLKVTGWTQRTDFDLTRARGLGEVRTSLNLLLLAWLVRRFSHVWHLPKGLWGPGWWFLPLFCCIWSLLCTSKLLHDITLQCHVMLYCDVLFNLCDWFFMIIAWKFMNHWKRRPEACQG